MPWKLRHDWETIEAGDAIVRDLEDSAEGIIILNALARDWPLRLRQVFLVTPEGGIGATLTRESALESKRRELALQANAVASATPADGVGKTN